jgi:phospholipid/cholesterol/gamma-HCH transport system substrate-binding protein
MPSAAKHYDRIEIIVGFFVFLGTLYLLYIAIGLFGKWNVLGTSGYVLYADFFSASGLNVGDPVEIAGVEVGTVASVSLADDQAHVGLRIKDTVTINDDAIASIETKGLIGDKSVSIDPGNSEKRLGPGAEINETESPPSLQFLIGKLVAGDLLYGE